MDSERVEITADLIAVMLREQHPDLADLPLSLGALGDFETLRKISPLR